MTKREQGSADMDERTTAFETRLIHAGRPHPRIEGAAVVPIFQCSVFEHDEGSGSYDDVRYPRLSNLPNHRALSVKLASLEGAEDALVTSSGMAAISTTLLEVLGGRGHLLVQDQLYGGTHAFVARDLAAYGIEHDFVSGDDPDGWRAMLRPETRAIYVEALTNPLLRVADHRAVVEFARRNELISIVDNTFATPVNFRPAEHGFDLSVHSGTKYLNGHSDLVCGAVIGSAERVGRIRKLLGHLGGSLDPHGCFLLDRGLKTMALRVRRQNESALLVAAALAVNPAVSGVNYAGLESHPDHTRARELFRGFGGVLSFELEGGAAAAKRFVERVEIPINGPSLGGVESLVTRPVTTSHATLTTAERERLGIGDGLVRVSVGIEDVGDLIRDFEQALAAD
jgi:cystathionine beta-lyase/cystathionine gamma-synthase